MNDDWNDNEHYSIDPFPCIPPALLNSADIARYAQAGCLVTSFNRSQIKPASYTMNFLGTLYRWDWKGDRLKKEEEIVCPGKVYELPRNSISYLFTKEQFRLPEYIAARLNFRIPFVHKGMLLGTGPLVDPGFSGSLLIPLHNLTNNHYYVKGGDGLIWVEFTKLSPHEYWRRPQSEIGARRPADLVDFPKEKRGPSAAYYLQKSEVTGAGGVQSAFAGALENAREATDEAKVVTGRLSKISLYGGIVAAFGLAVAIGALLLSSHQLSQSSNQLSTRIHDRLTNHELQIETHRIAPSTEEVERLREEIQNLRARVQQLEGRGHEMGAGQE